MFAKSLLAATLVVAAAAPVHAEVAEAYRTWASGPASLLFTAADRQAWAAVATDQDADLFVRLFWARRDPDPTTPENEFRTDFDRRVATAAQFGNAETPGFTTDRGKAIIVFGPPTRVVRLSPGGLQEEAVGEEEGEASPNYLGDATPGRPQQETWVYEKEQKPKSVTKKRLEIRYKTQGSGLVFAKADDMAETITAEVAAHVVQPNVTAEDLRLAALAAAAAAGPQSFHGTPAEPAQVAALRAWIAANPPAAPPAPTAPGMPTPAPGPTATTLDVAVFQAYDARWITPFQISLPAASAQGQKAVVEITNEQGESVLSFVTADAWETFGTRAYLQGNAALPVGNFTLTAGLLDAAGQVVWAAREAVVIPSGEPTFWISELVLSEQLYSLEKRQEMLEPWSWSSVAVVPKGDDTFAPGTTLWFYAHVCNAKLDANGKPALQSLIKLAGTRKYRGPVEVEPVKVNDSCWVLAQSIDLVAATFVAGTYELTLQVTDSAAGNTVLASRSFGVAAP